MVENTGAQLLFYARKKTSDQICLNPPIDQLGDGGGLSAGGVAPENLHHPGHSTDTDEVLDIAEQHDHYHHWHR